MTVGGLVSVSDCVGKIKHTPFIVKLFQYFTDDLTHTLKRLDVVFRLVIVVSKSPDV